MKAATTIFLAILIIALGAMVINDQKKIDGLKAELAMMKAGKEHTGSKAPDDKGGISGPGTGGDEARKNDGAESDPAGAPLRIAGAKQGTKQDDSRAQESRNPADALGAMMQNPAMKEFIRQDTKGRMKKQFGEFVEALGADEETSKSLYDLLIDREMSAIERIGKVMDDDIPEDAREAAFVDLATTWEGYQDQIEGLLGEDDFKDFELFEDSEPERSELDSLKKNMGERASELTLDQEEQLMAIMYEERKNFDFTNNYLDEEHFFEVDHSEKGYDGFRSEFEQLQKSIHERASGVLAPDQLEVFSENQANFRSAFIGQKQMESLLFAK